jgi:hypothetical protein
MRMKTRHTPSPVAGFFFVALLWVAMAPPAQVQAQECPPGSILARTEASAGEIRVFCKCLPGRVLKNGACVEEAERLDPACIRDCGLTLGTDVATCRDLGAECQIRCGLEVPVARCATDCVFGGVSDFNRCIAACGLSAAEAARCNVTNLRCKTTTGECFERALARDRFCRETCPER